MKDDEFDELQDSILSNGNELVNDFINSYLYNARIDGFEHRQ
jgi:hypothetical protein